MAQEHGLGTSVHMFFAFDTSKYVKYMSINFRDSFISRHKKTKTPNKFVFSVKIQFNI